MEATIAAAAPDVAALRAALDGQVVTPGGPGYDDARAVYYPAFDRRPAAIARVASAADVARVVAFARDRDLRLTVRGGGHSLAGHAVADGAVQLDLSGLRSLDLDLDGRSAWAGTGLTAGEYTEAAAAHGLATGFGDTGSVGIGGITLAGGVGFLVRKLGMTIDALQAAEVVTADGDLVRTDADTHPDLFWALRGGGGNVGIATRLQLRLHEVRTVLGGMMLLPATPEVIARFVAEADAAPEELSAIASVMVAPPLPFLPAEHHGQLVLLALVVHAGDPDAGERALAPLRALGPLVDDVKPVPYPAMFAGEGPKPAAMTVRNVFRDDVDGDAAERIVEHLRASTALLAAVQLRVLGGAMARVPADATAFAHRHRRLMVNVAAAYADPAQAAEHTAWVRGLAAALRQGEPGAYVGFLGDEGQERVREAYPGATWDRLAAAKRRYDPTNLFRGNQNVPPAPGRT